MRPQNPENTLPQRELFKTRLEDFLSPSHPLVQLAHSLDWEYFNREFGASFAAERGRPGLPTRLMAALSYLKHTYNMSDEAVVEEFLENPYWQYFCGFSHFQHEFPCDASSLTRWRKRLGDKGCQKLLSETLRLAHEIKLLKTKHLQDVIADTTVQEKNITHPTDAKLLHRAREKLVKAAKQRGIILRQSYSRVGKFLAFKQSRYAHARQYKRAQRAIRKLRTLLGRVMRDVSRKCPQPDSELKNLLVLSKRLYFQKKETSPKIYSLHEPHVDCISKGKAHKPFEFGCKTSVVTTARSNWVLGVKSFHGNPYDGHTLKAAIQDAEKTTGVTIQNIFVDKGYRGSKHWPKKKLVLLSGRSRLKPLLQKLLKRRSAIEPVIGHMKDDHRLRRNFLKGKQGDHLNAILAGAGFNFRKLFSFLTPIFDFSFFLFRRLNRTSGHFAYLPV